MRYLILSDSVLIELEEELYLMHVSHAYILVVEIMLNIYVYVHYF